MEGKFGRNCIVVYTLTRVNSKSTMVSQYLTMVHKIHTLKTKFVFKSEIGPMKVGGIDGIGALTACKLVRRTKRPLSCDVRVRGECFLADEFRVPLGWENIS